jgi:hypothetical protein
MRHVSLEEFCDIFQTMIVTQSVESGFAITHFGHINGVRTVAISTCHEEGDCYILQ